MADTPKLQPSDRSVEAYEKINKSIDHANEANNESSQANTTANEAKQISNDAKQIASESNQKSDSTQDQLDQVVIDGDSSVEAAQARVDTDGVSHQTLKERLDDEHTEVTTQLADITNKVTGFVNIEEFPIIDPEVDDTERLKRAHDHAYNNKKALMLAGKTYILSSKISLHPSTIMLGQGLNKTIIQSSSTDVALEWAYNNGVYFEGGYVGMFSLENTGSSESNTGLRVSNVYKGCLTDVLIKNFGINLQFQNQNDGWTEATYLENVRTEGAYIDEVQFNDGSGRPSFGYSNFKRLYINIKREGVTGIKNNGGNFYNGILNAVIWIDNGLTSANYVSNSGTFKGCQMSIVGEIPGNDGSTTGYFINNGTFRRNNGDIHIGGQIEYEGYLPQFNDKRPTNFRIGDTNRLFKAATIPPNDSNAFDQIELNIVGGTWSGSGKGLENFYFFNRDGFTWLWEQKKSQSNVIVKVYEQSDGTFDVYMEVSSFSSFSATVHGVGQDSNNYGHAGTESVFNYGINDVTGNTPTGTIVFNSSTDTPNI